MKQKWRMRFQHFYHHPIYWYYYQVKKWGKKNGIPSKKHETSQEYVKKLIKQIPKHENSFTHKNETYLIIDLLRNLNADYQVNYYSRGHQMEISSVEKYQQLIRHFPNSMVILLMWRDFLLKYYLYLGEFQEMVLHSEILPKSSFEWNFF